MANKKQEKGSNFLTAQQKPATGVAITPSAAAIIGCVVLLGLIILSLTISGKISSFMKSVSTSSSFSLDTPETNVPLIERYDLLGVPERLPETTKVDVANGQQFKNTIAFGTQGWLAEPGMLLPESIRGEGDYNVPETAYFIAQGQDMIVDLETVTAKIHDPYGAWNVIVRGYYGRQTDFTITQTAGSEVKLKKFPTGAFISEEDFTKFISRQTTKNHAVYTLFIDANTKAATVLRWQIDASNTAKPQIVWDNWQGQ